MRTKHRFFNPILEKLAEKLELHQEEIKDAICSSTIIDRDFFNLQGRLVACDDVLRILIETDIKSLDNENV